MQSPVFATVELSVCLSVCLYVCPSVRPSVCHTLDLSQNDDDPERPIRILSCRKDASFRDHHKNLNEDRPILLAA